MAVTWPLVRQLSFAPFRYRSRCKAAKRTALLTGYITFVGLAAVIAPVFLHFVAILAFSLLVFERWRARPGYGRSRRLPPGSLAIMSRGHERNPFHYETLIAKYGPILKLSRDMRPYVYIYGHERATRFLRDNDDAILGLEQPISRAIPNGFLRYMPPSVHSPYRKIIQSGISADLIDKSTPFISIAIRNALTQIAEDCRHASGGKVNFDTYLRDMIFAIVMKVFFAVDRDTPQFEKMSALHADIDTRTDTCGAGRRRHSSMAEMTLVLRQRVRATSQSPASSPPCFLNVMIEHNDAETIDPTVLGNWAGMVEFATIDIVGLLRWLLKMLIDFPAWIGQVREEQTGGLDRSRSADASLAERIVMETLRLERSEFLTRIATRDISFEGFRIPKGWSVRIGIREGNRNPEVFERATKFDPDRFINREYSMTEYAPFGLYRHNCIGAVFATVIGRIFVEEFAAGFDLEPGGDWKTEYAPPHWRPLAGYLIGLKARAPNGSLKQSA